MQQVEHVELSCPDEVPWGGFHPDPICYYSQIDKKEYIIVLPHYQNNHHVHIYDTTNDTWSANTSYNGLPLSEIGVTIDLNNNLLYIIGGSNALFASFHLIENTWNIKSRNILEATTYNVTSRENPVAIYVASSINELHVFNYNYNGGLHMKFDNNSQRFIKCFSDVDMSCVGIKKLIYLEYKQKFMIFAKEGIWETNVASNIDNNYKWNKLGITVPERVRNDSIITIIPAFGDNIIFVFTWKPEIWCFDVMDNKWVLYKDKILRFKFKKYMNVCKTSKYIHFFEAYQQIHFKVCMKDILPKKIMEKYSKKDELIIFGYVAVISEIFSIAISIDVVHLLLLFYSTI